MEDRFSITQYDYKNGHIRQKEIAYIVGEKKEIKAASIEEMGENKEDVKEEKIKTIEEEDTVYSVDTECIEKHKDNIYKKFCKSIVRMAGESRELVKITPLDFAQLPNKCWKLARNKFVLYGYCNYGHLGYMRSNDKYMICVPGKLDENVSAFAKRFGFNQYIPLEKDGEKEEETPGYWIMMIDNSK